ncbi:Os05g0485850 [Oryza sativa Japonica Group]|uniref:Os05g0485850 protein n=1 Tax=Oryza sativa subsp. japonica TaxID=39947 RepID=A0A0P0WNV8_ORYSJ|nr:hypothetical protein EE612_030267 [Oryza sativa]BAS94613.1 Os05g0485850 [Oryza sativa Japonica Group]
MSCTVWEPSISTSFMSWPWMRKLSDALMPTLQTRSRYVLPASTVNMGGSAAALPDLPLMTTPCGRPKLLPASSILAMAAWSLVYQSPMSTMWSSAGGSNGTGMSRRLTTLIPP